MRFNAGSDRNSAGGRAVREGKASFFSVQQLALSPQRPSPSGMFKVERVTFKEESTGAVSSARKICRGEERHLQRFSYSRAGRRGGQVPVESSNQAATSQGDGGGRLQLLGERLVDEPLAIK